MYLSLQVNHSVHIKPLMFTGVPETMAGKTAVFEDKTLCKKRGSGNQRHTQCHTKFAKPMWWCLLNCCQCCWLKVVTVIKWQRMHGSLLNCCQCCWLKVVTVIKWQRMHGSLLNCCQCCWLKVVTVIKWQRMHAKKTKWRKTWSLIALPLLLPSTSGSKKNCEKYCQSPFHNAVRHVEGVCCCQLHYMPTYEQLQMSMEPTLQCTNVL